MLCLMLSRSYWKAMNALGDVPGVNFLAPEQAAMLADRGAHLGDEDGLREVAYAALADGKHWSLLVYPVVIIPQTAGRLGFS